MFTTGNVLRHVTRLQRTSLSYSKQSVDAEKKFLIEADDLKVELEFTEVD